jgi:hypothetical protein
MRKRPDIILILSVLVVVGVIISNFVFINSNDKTNNTSLLYSSYIPLQNDKNTQKNTLVSDSQSSFIKLKEFVRIDSSKQQTH